MMMFFIVVWSDETWQITDLEPGVSETASGGKLKTQVQK